MLLVSRHVTILATLLLLVATNSTVAAQPSTLVFYCRADNDLYRVLTNGDRNYSRVESAAKAVQLALPGSGVLILADNYPKTTTPLDQTTITAAAAKRLRLFVEYPSWLPDMKVGVARRTNLERSVVASDAFGPTLKKLRILAIHDCHFVETAAPNAHLVAARVAGFDTALFGLDDVKTYPILFEHPQRKILVSTTKLSQFVTARYSTKDAVQAVWQMVFRWLEPEKTPPKIEWTPTVRPTYTRQQPLAPDATRQAIVRGIDWHTNARMLIDKSWQGKYDEYRSNGTVNPRNPVGPLPDSAWPAGDGRLGVLEGISSRIGYDGKQPARWWLRSDSNGETAMAFALRSRLVGDQRSRRVAANLLDWVYFNSGLFQNDPSQADFGLIHWAKDSGSLYGDNDIKAILSCMGTAALLETDRWDEPLLRNILGNFRTTGVTGFRQASISDKELRRLGWPHYWHSKPTHFAPHYQAWVWASYLWLYDKTGYEPLLERTRSAIGTMMSAYPDRWRWTNGIQQERGRMLLTLAWLVRVDDRPEHRAWLKQMAQDMQKCQDASGAIREELGNLANGQFRPPQSNAGYGTNEASMIQQNGDPVVDLLYTCNFAFLGLNEAHAATGDPLYREMADKLAQFLVRIQIRSEAHPELDGGWFRAFDFKRWDYWGSNADHGWGAWAIETGWTQAWIPSVLAMREMKLNLWDLTKNSKIARHWKKNRALMLPEDKISMTRTANHTLVAARTKKTSRSWVVNNRAINAADDNRGTEASPLFTIQAGANRAQPGDTVLVKAGIYREEVSPPRGGTSAKKPITYRAAPGEEVSIRGSERITTWVDQGDGVWMAELDVSFFKGYNPFARKVFGEWLHRGKDRRLGDVYLNGEAFVQKLKIEDMRSDPNSWYTDLAYGFINKTDFPKQRQYSDGKVQIWANFGRENPNTNLTEINARATAIFPKKSGLKHIVIDGFDIRHTAPQWGDIYTLEQGAIGTRLGYGWTIENCRITNSRNIGISLGVTDEVHFARNNKEEGGLLEGGNNIPPLDTIGHHLIRNNTISRCGQTSIYGCYGAVGCVIEGNVISETNYRNEWNGPNQAAIKILFPIDVVIRNNYLRGTPGINNATQGIWLDWGAQNARVTGNVVCDFNSRSSRGLFLEVDFGPIMVDNNVFVRSWIVLESNGSTLAHNLFSDCHFHFMASPHRPVPYFKPHSTERAGKSTVSLRHNHIFNNLIIGAPGFRHDNLIRNGADASGIVANHNIYLGGAGHFPGSDHQSVTDASATIVELKDDGQRVRLSLDLPSAVLSDKHPLITSKLIGRIPLAEMFMEHPNGDPLDIASDFEGKPISPTHVMPGPFQNIKVGMNCFVVWPGDTAKTAD